MYPFYLFDLPHDATDEQVEARYQELLRYYPPERAPREFAMVRSAYEQLRDARKRLYTWLFYYDDAGRCLSEDYPRWLQSRPRRRLSTGELAELIRRGAATLRCPDTDNT